MVMPQTLQLKGDRARGKRVRYNVINDKVLAIAIAREGSTRAKASNILIAAPIYGDLHALDVMGAPARKCNLSSIHANNCGRSSRDGDGTNRCVEPWISKTARQE